MPKRKKRKWTPTRIKEAAKKFGVSVSQYKAYLRDKKKAADKYLG